MGFRSIISFRLPGEPAYDEARAVGELGMDYHNPAFRGVGSLTDEKIDECLDTLRSAQRPALVHCGSANRVGAIWLAWRCLEENADPNTAVEEAKSVGLRSPAYEQRILEFIHSRRKDSSH